MSKYIRKIKKVSKIRFTLILWIVVIIYALFIFQLSNATVEDQPQTIKKTEQVVNATVNKVNQGTGGNIDSEKNMPIIKHSVLYMGFGFLLFFAIYSTKKLKRKKLSAPISFFSGFCYGITDEVHQFFITGRDGTINDIFVNGLGILLGILLAIGIYKLTKLLKRNYSFTKKNPNSLKF